MRPRPPEARGARRGGDGLGRAGDGPCLSMIHRSQRVIDAPEGCPMDINCEKPRRTSRITLPSTKPAHS